MKKLDSCNFYLPMPVTLVGTEVGGRENFFAAAWVSQVNTRPVMFGFAANRTHYSCQGIEENRAFSICLPGRDLLRQTDHAGIVSGRDVDKSKVFTTFSGGMRGAPMIEGAAVCMECKLTETVVLPTHTFFIGSVQGVWCSPEVLDEKGKPSLEKLQPFMLSMPDNQYSILGDVIGKAWNPDNRQIQAVNADC